MKTLIRKDDQAVSPVIATILMVAITVVLAAVLYVMVAGLLPGTTTSGKPTVSLIQSNKLPNGMDVYVAGITPTAAPSNFKVNLENVSSTTFGTAVAAPTVTSTPVTVTIGAQTFSITWQNPGGSGQVSAGDHYVVTSTAIKAGSSVTYSFLLIWSDGSTLTSLQWQA
jgi:flagellin-like protein